MFRVARLGGVSQVEYRDAIAGEVSTEDAGELPVELGVGGGKVERRADEPEVDRLERQHGSYGLLDVGDFTFVGEAQALESTDSGFRIGIERIRVRDRPQQRA